MLNRVFALRQRILSLMTVFAAIFVASTAQARRECSCTWRLGNICMEKSCVDIPDGPSTPAPSYYKLKLHNACNRSIRTAIHYRETNNNWTTEGWWVIKPGDTAYVADTKNRIYYTYAETTTANNQLTWTGPHQWNVNGNRTVGFKKSEMSASEYGPWTHRFTCN